MAQLIAVRGVPNGPQLGVTAKLAVLEVMVGVWVKDREGQLSEAGRGVLTAGGGHGGDGG